MSLDHLAFNLPPTPHAMPIDERIAALVDSGRFVRVDAEGAAAFARAPGDSVLLLTADTRNNPESWDALIILPEVLRAHASVLRAAIVPPGEAAKVALRFGVRSYPALVFQRGGEYVGSIEGLQEWQAYVQQTAALLAAPTTRAPSIGIAVVGPDGSTCH